MTAREQSPSEAAFLGPLPWRDRDPLPGWMQAAPLGILLTDTKLRVIGWNEWLVSRSGMHASDTLGRELFELFPDIVERRLDGPFRRALEGETAVLATALHGYLLRLPPPSRDLGVAHMRQTARIVPLLADGGIVGTITIIEDVTQREHQARILRRQQEHDRLLTLSLALLLQAERPMDAVAGLFPQIAVPLQLDVFFNYLLVPGTDELQLQSANGVSSEARRSLATLRLDSPTPCASCARDRQPLILSDAATSTDPRAQFLRKLGVRSYAAFPLLIGERLLGTLSFGSYARDSIAADEITFLRKLSQYIAITIDRAQREQALHEARASLARHAETLETTVAERTARLRETIEELESFSHTVAHDLRAPIRWLSGYTEILLDDHRSEMPAAAVAIVERLAHAGERLDALTRDLLAFSRVARQDVTLEPVDVAELVANLAALMPGLRGGVLRVQGDLGWVSAQRTLLEQCLANLFGNALKFVRPDAPPRIVIRAERREAPRSRSVANLTPLLEPRAPEPEPLDVTASTGRGKWVRLWVEDNGIGIPPGMERRIFGIFERAGNVKHIEGTGIGLAIVARAVQRMGGTCGVEACAGPGARFWLELASA